ncbi:MAG: hypothetical protein RLZZ519_1852 [Bacteroidota bacterium]|jgi:hypothetical protein
MIWMVFIRSDTQKKTNPANLNLSMNLVYSKLLWIARESACWYCVVLILNVFR